MISAVRVSQFFTHPLRILFAVCFSFVMLTLPRTATAYDIIVGTGMAGSISYHTGKALCRIFEQGDPELNCSLISSSDNVDILTNVQEGSLDFALSDSFLLQEALDHKGPFSFLDINYDRLRLVNCLYEVPLSLVVKKNSGITSGSGLKGKRVNVGPPGSLERRLFNAFLQANSWTKKDFALLGELPRSFSQDKLAFKQGSVQALVFHGVHPNPEMQLLLENSGASLIGFEDGSASRLVARNPSLLLQKISRMAYPSLTEDVNTWGTTMALITSADMDDETIDTVVTTLINKGDRLRTVHPALATFQVASRDTWFGGLKTHDAVPGVIQARRQE